MPTIVRGYHGTVLSDAQRIVQNRQVSARIEPYHWLGQGFYFWEDAPLRAWTWALYRAKREQTVPAVVSAYVTLRNCFDLLDIDMWNYIRAAQRLLELRARRFNIVPLPQQLPPSYLQHNNRKKRHEFGALRPTTKTLPFNYNHLDCMAVDIAVRLATQKTGSPVCSVRGSFLEGQQLYPTSFFFDRSHVQIAVRDPGMISDLIIEDSVELERRFGAAQNVL